LKKSKGSIKATNNKCTAEEQCRRILEDKGGWIADRTMEVLLKDQALKDFKEPLEFISKNWRDPLTPTLMSLSCEAVGGNSKKIHDAAIAVSLMHLSFFIWDDILDKTVMRSFKPTILGRFGEASFIVGGISSAKAFTILNQMKTDTEKRKAITKAVWNLWAKMAQAEIRFQRRLNESSVTCRSKLWKIKTEAIDTETCMKIGAILGNGSPNEIDHLGKCGLYLGIVLELWKDFRVSANLTLELAERIKSGSLTYSLLWASEKSNELRRNLEIFKDNDSIEPINVKDIVEEMLAAKTFDFMSNNIRRYVKKAEKERRYLKKNDASRMLLSLINVQPKLFSESLSTLKAYAG
jgi:geranylgeranyl pyrophosphate synthase